MNGLGEGIAFISVVAAAAFLEVNGRQAEGLWALIVIWVVFSNFGQDKIK